MKLLDLEITEIAFSGHGIARHPSRGDIFILGTFPGDIVRAEIYHTVAGNSYAEIVSFIEYSDLRSHNPIEKPFFSPNTPWQHLSINTENTIKQESLVELYSSSISESNLSQLCFPDNLPETAYRNKVAYSFMQTKTKSPKLCFALYTRGIGGSKKIPQTHNELVHPTLETVGKKFLGFFNQRGLTKHDLKYLILRYSYHENNVVAHMLVPETNRKKLPFKKIDIEKFVQNTKYLKGVVISHSEPGVRSALTTKDFFEIGDIQTNEKVLGKTYSYHPSLFFQIYPKAFEDILSDLRTLIDTIPNHAELPVLDLFAGVGIIGLEIADLVPQVLGVELSALSKYYARKNAKDNSIENYHFMEKSVDDILTEITSDQILIVDPTRTGLSAETIAVINEKLPAYIFYISCNPETQFENYEALSGDYNLEFIKPYNIFPKTHHTESMIMLKRK